MPLQSPKVTEGSTALRLRTLEWSLSPLMGRAVMRLEIPLLPTCQPRRRHLLMKYFSKASLTHQRVSSIAPRDFTSERFPLLHGDLSGCLPLVRSQVAVEVTPRAEDGCTSFLRTHSSFWPHHTAGEATAQVTTMTAGAPRRTMTLGMLLQPRQPPKSLATHTCRRPKGGSCLRPTLLMSRYFSPHLCMAVPWCATASCLRSCRFREKAMLQPS
jgi:hypothetical protein